MRRLAPALTALALFISLAPAPAAAGGLEYMKARLAAAPVASEGATAWERRHLTPVDRADLARTKFTPKGALVRVVDSGLDLYRDTPDFDNFVALVGKHLGNGTCLGMCEIVKNSYEKATYTGGAARGVSKADLARLILGVRTRIEGFANLRDLTRREPDAVKAAMDAAHLGNLKPESWLPWLRDAAFGVSGVDTYRDLVARLRFGHPAKLSIQSEMPSRERRIGPVGVNLPDPGDFKGHVLLAWKAIEFEGNALLFVYDPNVAYKADRSNAATCFALDKSTGRLELFPASFAGGYPWVKSILCIDGLVGPWADELKHAFGGFLDRVSDAVGDAVDTVKEKAGEAADWARRRLGDAGRTLRRGWDAVTRGFGKLF